MDYREQLRTEIAYHLQKAENLIQWMAILDAQGVDWTNLTDEQKFNIYYTPAMPVDKTYHIHKSYPWHCGSTTGIQATDERMVDCKKCLEKKL